MSTRWSGHDMRYFLRAPRTRVSRSIRWLALLLWAAIPLLTGCPPPVTCLRCGNFETVGWFSDPAILECSGMVASRSSPGILWVHNDSGDAARIFAVQEDGTLRGIYTLQDARALDWEDIAWGPCSEGGAPQCLYIGDIGDNGRVRTEVQIYRVPEPVVPLEGPPVYETIQGVERFDCRYPDGPRNAETVVVDPESALPYIVTKEPAGATGVYRFPHFPAPGETVTLEKLGTLASGEYLTGGDVAPDASRIIVRDNLTAYEYPRLPGQSFAQIFATTPCIKDLAQETQGEALAIGVSGLEIFTASEGLGAPIHRASCTAP